VAGEQAEVIGARELSRDEIPQVWSIDRSEVIDHIYYYENGEMVLKPEHYDMHGWPPGEPEHNMPGMLDCFDRGGWFCGLFDGDKLIGVVILESKFIGREGDQLQLKFLHISSEYRDTVMEGSYLNWQGKKHVHGERSVCTSLPRHPRTRSTFTSGWDAS
jgi:hypothetical protein